MLKSLSHVKLLILQGYALRLLEETQSLMNTDEVKQIIAHLHARLETYNHELIGSSNPPYHQPAVFKTEMALLNQYKVSLGLSDFP